MDNYYGHVHHKRSHSSSKYRDKLFSLPLEEKLIGAGLLIAVLGCFLPWANFPGVDNVRSISYNGFQGVTYFLGYSILALGLGGAVLMLAKFMEVKRVEQMSEKLLPYYTFAAGQITFLSIVAYTIYSSFYKVKYSGSYVEFGLAICLAGGLITLVGAYFSYNERKHKEQRKKTLHHLQEMDDEASRILDQYSDEREFQAMGTVHPDQTSFIEEEAGRQHIHS